MSCTPRLNFAHDSCKIAECSESLKRNVPFAAQSAARCAARCAAQISLSGQVSVPADLKEMFEEMVESLALGSKASSLS